MKKVGLRNPTESAEDLAAALGDWEKGTGPRYKRLADAISAAIERGEVPPGVRLSAERRLAEVIGVSRTTVVAAYDLLRQQGRVSMRVGSGTYVHGPRDLPGLHLEPLTDRGQQPDRPRPTDGVINLSVSWPAPITDLLQKAMSAATEDLDDISSLRAYAPQGYGPLRQAIAEIYSRRGVPTTERQILVTSGAQQAISLITQALVPGGTVAVESPTFLGALDSFAAEDARIVAAPAGDGEALVAVSGRNQCDIVYFMPRCHYVVGKGMAPAGRAAVTTFAVETDTCVVDDDILAGLMFDEPYDTPSLEDVNANVLTLGSLTKLFWLGLRLGWVRGPERIIAQLVREKSIADLGTSLVTQLVGLRLLEHTGEVENRRRHEIRTMYELAAEGIRSLLPDWDCPTPAGGRSLWIRLPVGGGDQFAQSALQHGVLVTAGSTFGTTHSDHIRFLFVQDPETLTEAIHRLATTWAAYVRQPSRALHAES